MKINPDRSNSVQFIIQSKSSKSVRTALTKLIPEQFTVLLGTGNKFQVGGVLVAVKILLSVGSINCHKKDCLKMCDHPKKSDHVSTPLAWIQKEEDPVSRGHHVEVVH